MRWTSETTAIDGVGTNAARATNAPTASPIARIPEEQLISPAEIALHLSLVVGAVRTVVAGDAGQGQCSLVADLGGRQHRLVRRETASRSMSLGTAMVTSAPDWRMSSAERSSCAVPGQVAWTTPARSK